MKMDPNKACSNIEQKLLWALIHDIIAHPIMAIFGYSKWAKRFHNFTSHRAWPRDRNQIKSFTVYSESFGMVEGQDKGKGFWTISHPGIRHDVTVKANDVYGALEQAEDWFKTL